MKLFNLFKKEKNMIQEYIAKGAIILDVRTVEEWNAGHIEGSKLITLSEIASNVEEIKSWEKSIIAVCKSGNRSNQATMFLSQFDIDIINGGAWNDLQEILTK